MSTSDEFNKIFENEKKAQLRREAEDFISLEKQRLCDISEAQLNGIVNFTSREVPDATICEACLVTRDQLNEIRQSTNYKTLLQIAQAGKLGKHLSVDEKIDKLEDLSVSRLIDEVQNNRNGLEVLELLAIGRFSNAAKRRLGQQGSSIYNRPGENKPIDLSNNSVININISSIVLDRIKAVNQNPDKVIDYAAIEAEYDVGESKSLDIKKVGEILSVDLSKNTARNPTVAESYHDLFEDTQSVYSPDDEG
jgi:hypothetical protein